MPYRFIDYSFPHWTFNSIPHSINYIFFSTRLHIKYNINIISMMLFAIYICERLKYLKKKKKSAKGYFMMKKYVIKKGRYIFHVLKIAEIKMIWFHINFLWNKIIKRSTKSIIHQHKLKYNQLNNHLVCTKSKHLTTTWNCSQLNLIHPYI